MSAEDQKPAESTPETQPINENSTEPSTESALETVEDESFEPHPLNHKWTFWYSTPNKNGGVGGWTNLKMVHSFDTVEEMWRTLNAVKPPSVLNVKNDCYLFKEGIAPEWEDPKNQAGGKWQFTISKESLPFKFANTIDELWLHSILAVVGEQFTEGDEIHGLTLVIRGREIRIALWTKTASNTAAQQKIGEEWKALVSSIYEGKLEYQSHNDAQSAGPSYRTQSMLTL